MDYSRILRVLGRADNEVAAIFRVGSRVYGTASPTSDEDFVVVLSRQNAKQDLAFGKRMNVVVHGMGTFQEALDDHSVFALECIFLPTEHRIKAPVRPFGFTLDRTKLAASAGGRSASDFKKAAKRFADEPWPSKKKLFHSLRVPMFALQVARGGRITDYGEANGLWYEILAREDLEWAAYDAAYGQLREKLCDELTAIAAAKRR